MAKKRTVKKAVRVETPYAATVFNKKAIQESINVPPEKIIDVLTKSMVVTTDNTSPRNYGDYVVSISLEKQERLGLHPIPKKGKGNYSLKEYLTDLANVNPDYRIKKAVVFDTETTGYTGYAASMAFVLYNLETKEVEKTFYALINPQERLSADVIKVHGITNEHVKNEPTFDHYWPEVKEFFDEADIAVGQNLVFDMKVLEREFERMGVSNTIETYPIFDTMTYAKYILNIKDKNGKKVKAPSLEESMRAFNLPLPKLEEGQSFHNALVDTEGTLAVFKKLIAIDPETLEY